MAVREGRWLLLEDVARAPADLLAALLPVLEQRRLFLPGRGEWIEAAPAFQLLATHTLRPGETPLIPLAAHWAPLDLPPLTGAALEALLVARCPRLRPHLPLLLSTWTALEASPSPPGGRPQTVRDLVHWAQRVEHTLRRDLVPGPGHLAAGVREEVVLDLADLFCASLPEAPLRLALTATAARPWEVAPDRVQQLLEGRVPEVRLSEGEGSGQGVVRVGRALLPLGPLTPDPHRRPFAWTRTAAQLVERLARGVEQGEPMLLVGETGSGKTSAIQELAALARRPLRVINLSQVPPPP